MIFSYALKSEISEGEKERKRKKSLSLGSEKFTRISRFARFRRSFSGWPIDGRFVRATSTSVTRFSLMWVTAMGNRDSHAPFFVTKRKAMARAPSKIRLVLRRPPLRTSATRNGASTYFRFPLPCTPLGYSLPAAVNYSRLEQVRRDSRVT